MLLVPATVALHELWLRRLGRREVTILMAAPGAYVAWLLVVRALAGSGLSGRANLGMPFQGLFVTRSDGGVLPNSSRSQSLWFGRSRDVARSPRGRVVGLGGLPGTRAFLGDAVWARWEGV